MILPMLRFVLSCIFAMLCDLLFWCFWSVCCISQWHHFQELDDIYLDVQDECEQFGQVVSIQIPRDGLTMLLNFWFCVACNWIVTLSNCLNRWSQRKCVCSICWWNDGNKDTWYVAWTLLQWHQSWHDILSTGQISQKWFFLIDRWLPLHLCVVDMTWHNDVVDFDIAPLTIMVKTRSKLIVIVCAQRSC